MSEKIIPERVDIDPKYKWDLASMYKDEAHWNQVYNEVTSLTEDFAKYEGNLITSGSQLFKALEDMGEITRRVRSLYSYASMNLDQDTRVGKSQELSSRALGAYVLVSEKTSFVEPEILSLTDAKIEEFYKAEPKLEKYRHYLNDTLRLKDYVLSAREESILAQMGEVSAAPQTIFSMLNNADLTFETIIGENGKEIEITHGNFIPLLESEDRGVRERAFKSLYKTYGSFKNTFAASLNGDLKKNIFESNLRGYKSSREASLAKNNVELSVYDNLIESIHDNLDTMYKYMEIRKRALGLDELHMYDLHTPMVKDFEMKIAYEDGVELVKEGLKPLGSEYMEVVEEGFSSGWIDVYENRGKRSGAYSGGSYDSKPYILLNYHDTLDNVFTTAHEMGHSIHSYFTRKNQPYVYGDYCIFVAEVASTVNESLLINHMLDKAVDKKERLFLINHYLDTFKSTVFRQTMFAEFEKIMNEHLEAGGALTADFLCQEYKKLNELYYGPGVVIDEEIAMEWARIPHFYYNYYVFQYATGYSAAASLTERILEEGQPAVDDYIGFLKSGSSDYPLEVLKRAGVDMTTREPVDKAMKLFKKLVDEMDSLID